MSHHEGENSLSVLLVSEPGLDGVFRHVEKLAHYLIGAGAKVHFAYSSVRGSRSLDELVRLLEARGFRTMDLQVGNVPGPADARALARLWQFARELRPDVIHAHSSKAGVLARTLSMLGVRARYFYTPHAYFEMHKPSGVRRRVFLEIERLFSRIGTTLNCSASEAAYARSALGLPANRQRLIPNGIDCIRFRPPADEAEKQAARREFDLPAEGRILGTVARYSKQKDPLTLYRAALDAMQRAPSLHLAHLGRGELFEEVDRLVADAPAAVQARIHRREGSENTAAFYRALDAFALPSRYEGFALAALEAIATGLPLILADCFGNVDLKNYPLNQVRWAPPEDPAKLSAEIVAWAGSPPGFCNHRVIALKEFEARTCYGEVFSCYKR